MALFPDLTAIVSAAAARIFSTPDAEQPDTNPAAASSLSQRTARNRPAPPRVPLPLQASREEAGFGATSALIPPRDGHPSAFTGQTPGTSMPPELKLGIISHMDTIDGAWALFGSNEQLGLAMDLRKDNPEHTIALLNFNPVAREQLARLADPASPLPDGTDGLEDLSQTLWTGAQYLVAPQHCELRAKVFDKLGLALNEMLRRSPADGAVLLEQVAGYAVAASAQKKPTAEMGTELVALLKLGQVVQSNAVGEYTDVLTPEQRNHLQERLSTLSKDATSSFADGTNPRLVLELIPTTWKGAGEPDRASFVEGQTAALERAIAQPNFPIAAYQPPSNGVGTKEARAQVLGGPNPPDVRVHQALDTMLLRRLKDSPDSAERLDAWEVLTSRGQQSGRLQDQFGEALVSMLEASGGDKQQLTAVFDAVREMPAFRNRMLQSLAAQAHEAAGKSFVENVDQARTFIAIVASAFAHPDGNSQARKDFLSKAADCVKAMPHAEGKKAMIAALRKVLATHVKHDHGAIADLGTAENSGYLQKVWDANRK